MSRDAVGLGESVVMRTGVAGITVLTGADVVVGVMDAGTENELVEDGALVTGAAVMPDPGSEIEAGLAVVRVCTGDPVMAGDHDRVWLGLTFGTMENVGFVVPLGTWESEGKKEGKMDELGP